MTPRKSVLITSPDQGAAESEPAELTPSGEPVPPDQRQSTAADLIQFVGTWHGDDIEECLDLVYATRSVWYP